MPAEKRLGMRDGRVQDRLVVETWLPFREGAPVIEVVFPFEYPDEAPTVYGPPGLLDRHQQPRSGNFCLAEDPDHDWWPGMAAAELIDHDLRWLFEDMEKGPEAVRRGEADMPEPVTGLMTFGEGVVVVPDPFFEEVLPAGEGRMTLIGGKKQYMLASAANLGEADPDLRERYFKDGREHVGYWVALAPTPVPAVFDFSLTDAVERASPRVFERLKRRLKERQSESVAETWLGVTFMEEGPTRGEQRRNWVFTRVQLDRAGAKRNYEKLQAQALTVKERQRRIPELVGLADARVLLVGAGSLGSSVAFELVKAGVGHVDVVDYDRFDVNNSVRHVLTPQWAGANKAVVTALYAEHLNPFVTVEHHAFTVGFGAEEYTRLSALEKGATVVVDTTGSQSVGRILQKHCTRLGKPLVVGGLTAGSYGGEVVVLRPGQPCLSCFVLAQADGDIRPPDAAPPSSQVTPVGCSHPAFSGAGFDATELAAILARTVIQVTEMSAYPAADWDWAVVNFRGEPRWETGRLVRHAGCPHCAR